jgi:cytidylate kinase
MYRAIGLEAIRRQADFNDMRGLTYIAKLAKITFDWTRNPPLTLLNGESVGHLLRGSGCTKAASYVAAVPAIRELMVQQQREIGQERGRVVTEGRDQGTIVFPNAQLKIYLDADPQERARRRAAQLRSRGEIVDVNEILDSILVRDRRDATRSVGPLAIAADAQRIDTTMISERQVVEQIVNMAQALLPAEHPTAR